MRSDSSTRLERSDNELRVFYKRHDDEEEEEMMRITLVDRDEDEDEDEEDGSVKSKKKSAWKFEEMDEGTEEFLDSVESWNQMMRERFCLGKSDDSPVLEVKKEAFDDEILAAEIVGRGEKSPFSEPIPQTPYPNARSVGTRRRAREVLLGYARKPPVSHPSTLVTSESMKTLYSKSLRLGASDTEQSVTSSRSSNKEVEPVEKVGIRHVCVHVCDHPEKPWLTSPERDRIKSYYSNKN